MKKIWVLFLLLLMMPFRIVLASDGRCGQNVIYTIKGDTISFSKESSDKEAGWKFNCKRAIEENTGIRKVEIIDPITTSIENILSFTNLAHVEEMYLSNLDISNINNMNGMFWGDESLKVLDISGWNTSHVNNMGLMFHKCKSLKTIKLGAFDTSNVTSFNGMFDGCESLASIDISGFKTSKAEDMSLMFHDCKSLKTVKLGKINTSNVTNMAGMFWGCESLSSVDVSGINTSNVEDMSSMFSDCKSLKTVKLGKINTSNVVNMTAMFSGCESLTNLDVSSFDLSTATNISAMYEGCKSLTYLDVSGWNTSNVTDMRNVFRGCSSLINLDVSKWNTSNVTDMTQMFSDASSLTNLDVSKWNTSKVTRMMSLFSDASSLTSLGLSNWNTSNVTDMKQMFYGASSLTNLDVSKWNTSKVTTMKLMFNGAGSLESLDLSGWNTSNVTDATQMFGFCKNLKTLTLGQNTVKKNIFESLPKYTANWYYTAKGETASNALDLYSVKSNGKLFSEYNYKKMAGTWTTEPLAKEVIIQDASGKTISNQTVPIHTKTFQLKAVALPEDAIQKFTWKSSNTKIATVSSSGKVTFLKSGSVTITATADDGSKKSVTLILNYTPLATSVSIKNASGKVITGKTETINTAVYKLSAQALPSDADQRFSWTSSNTTIATVDADGKVSFKKAGTVTISARAIDGSNKSASADIKYIPPVTSVTIRNAAGNDVTGKSITIGTTVYQLTASGAPAGSLQSFNWRSSDTNTATVDAKGNVTFKKTGTVTITATATDGSKKYAQVKLTYEKAQAPNLSIKDTNIRGKNNEVQITIPWNDGLIQVDAHLYDADANKEVKPNFKERMDVNGKNRVISWVGDPLENGKVYRFRVRVSNGQWSNWEEKYAMPIANVYGATVVAGNKTMVINNQHREPTTGTRYMLFDAATDKELAYKKGTKTDTTWKCEELQNGKLYYVVAVPYREYEDGSGQKQTLWGPNQNRIYFIPMAKPGNVKVSFSNDTTAVISANSASDADGIRVLYKPEGNNAAFRDLYASCKEKTGFKCTVSGVLNKNTNYTFYVMKFKEVDGKKYFSFGVEYAYRNAQASGLSSPQNNPVVTMTGSGYTTFKIKKAQNAEGVSVLYREEMKNEEGKFLKACESERNKENPSGYYSCSVTLDTTKNYSFYIMQYRFVNGKKVYSEGIVARDFSSMKNGEFERLYTGFTLADENFDMTSINDALDDFYTEEDLLREEAFAALGEELVSKDVETFDEEDDFFDYSGFDDDAPYGEYEDDASDDGYEPEELYDEGIDPEYGPEAGWEEPFDEVDEPQEESEELYMYYFGNGEKPLPPAPSFGNL